MVNSFKNGTGSHYSDERVKLQKGCYWAQNKENIKNLLIPWGAIMILINMIKNFIKDYNE